MLRRQLLILAVAALPAAAQMWPETWHGYTRVKDEPVAIADQALFSEYGGEAAGTALYNGSVGKFRATGWRMKDSTGALAWYQAMRPENGVPVRRNPLSVTTPGSQWMVHKNYVLEFEGWRPTPADLDALWPLLPQTHSGGGLPLFAGYLPDKDRIRNSERYISGLTSLERFETRIPSIAAGFEDNAEIALAKYRNPGGDLTLALFSYPTNQVARLRAAELEKLPNWVVKRTGPYVAAVPEATDRAAAANLLDQINYNANFTVNQATKMPPMPDVGGMLTAIVNLTGVLLVFCLGGGVLFAWLWLITRRRTKAATGSESEMTFLDLNSSRKMAE